MHKFEAFRCLLCLIQGVFMEILQGGRQIWCANRRRKKAVGRRKRTGVRKTCFCLGSGAGRCFCFWSGASKNIWAEIPARETSSRSLNCTFPFLDVGGWSRGKLSLNGTGAGTAYQALGGSLVASYKICVQFSYHT
jgi:hypothetical protein